MKKLRRVCQTLKWRSIYAHRRPGKKGPETIICHERRFRHFSTLHPLHITHYALAPPSPICPTTPFAILLIVLPPKSNSAPAASNSTGRGRAPPNVSALLYALTAPRSSSNEFSHTCSAANR